MIKHKDTLNQIVCLDMGNAMLTMDTMPACSEPTGGANLRGQAAHRYLPSSWLRKYFRHFELLIIAECFTKPPFFKRVLILWIMKLCTEGGSHVVQKGVMFGEVIASSDRSMRFCTTMWEGMKKMEIEDSASNGKQKDKVQATSP